MDSSRLTEIHKNRMLYANYLMKYQTQSCYPARTGLENGLVAPARIIPDLLDGAQNTSLSEQLGIVASARCPIVTTAVSEPTYEVVQDGLVLYYNVGDSESYPGSGTTIFDLSPSGYDGTISGATYDSADGGSLLFDGVNDYIDTNQSLGYEQYTLMAWFKTSDVTDYRMLISKETTTGSQWNYRMFLNITSGHLIGDMKTAAASTDEITYSQDLADGQWHMTAYSRNTSTDKVNLYIDGILVKSETDTLPAGTIINSQEVWIGRSAFTGGGGTGSYPWDGNIAATLIYNRALTDDEVDTNYKATKTRFGL